MEFFCNNHKGTLFFLKYLLGIPAKFFWDIFLVLQKFFDLILRYKIKKQHSKHFKKN